MREAVRFFVEAWRWLIPMAALTVYMGASLVGAVLSGMAFYEESGAIPATVLVFWGPLGLAGLVSIGGLLAAKGLDSSGAIPMRSPRRGPPSCPVCGSGMVQWEPNGSGHRKFWCCERFPDCDGVEA